MSMKLGMQDSTCVAITFMIKVNPDRSVDSKLLENIIEYTGWSMSIHWYNLSVNHNEMNPGKKSKKILEIMTLSAFWWYKSWSPSQLSTLKYLVDIFIINSYWRYAIIQLYQIFTEWSNTRGEIIIWCLSTSWWLSTLNIKSTMNEWRKLGRGILGCLFLFSQTSWTCNYLYLKLDLF